MPRPLTYASRNEFYNSIVDAKNEFVTSTGKTVGTYENEKIEGITSYFDFKNVVKEVELFEVSATSAYVALDFSNKNENRSETDALLIETFRWVDVDENVYLNSSRSNSSVDIRMNGKTVIKWEYYGDSGHILNQYNWVQDGHAMFMRVPAWLLELYPEKTFFDLQIVNVITVKLNGTYLNFDEPPITEDYRTLVPLRGIFEELGAKVEWDNDTETVTATKGDTAISLQIGSNVLVKNGEAIKLDVPAKLVGARTLVPVRAVSEGLGAKVEWDEGTQTVVITAE